MKVIKLLVGSSLLLASSIAAAVDAPASIATVGEVNGNVLIEHADKRIVAKEGMSLIEGDTIFVLEKATVDLAYASCNTVLDQNTLLTISADAPCATGMQIGVGAAGADGAGNGNTTRRKIVGAAVLLAGMIAAARNSGGGGTSSTGSNDDGFITNGSVSPN